MRKFFIILFLGVLVVILNVAFVFIPTLNDIKVKLVVYLLNKNIPIEPTVSVTIDKDIENLPNASSFFTVTYDYTSLNSGSSPNGSKEDNIFNSGSSADSSEANNRNYYYLDFQLFLDSLFHGQPTTKDWSNWNMEEYYIHSYIVEVIDNSLVLNIVYPEGKTFSNMRKKVSTECTRKNSVLASSENFDLLNTNIDIFFEAKVGDGFFAYCLDVECNVVGKSCVLVKQRKSE
jgi:hypothetical protein